MAIKIGHASIAENGTVNGNKGDQTGKEVCTRTWYSKPWDFVLRPLSADVAERSAKACEAGCANNNIGYSQNNRNTAHTEAKKVGYDLSKIKTPCNTDCSAFMTLCALAAGVKKLEYTGNAPTTSTMKNAFRNSLAYEVLTDKKYLTSDQYLKRGDILVKAGSHTVMALENGAKAFVQEKTQVPSSFYPKYTGTCFVLDVILTAIGADLDFDAGFKGAKKRHFIAEANGFLNYSGTAEQNTVLINLAKAGTLKRPQGKK